MYLSFRISLFCLFASLFVACDSDQDRLPKPRMYPKVEYPSQFYEEATIGSCPFSFEIPQHTVIEQKENFFDETHDCWFDIRSEVLNYDIHCSYTPISKVSDLVELLDDSFKIADEHNQKANYRDERIIQNLQGVEGLQFEIGGPVASPVQFFLTDSTHHFFRASLYFKAKVNPDSIAPVLTYAKKDIKHIVGSFEWR